MSTGIGGPALNIPVAQAAALGALAAGAVASASITFGPASGMTAEQVIDIPCGTSAAPKLVRLQAQISGSPAVATAPYTILNVTGMSAIQVAAAVRAAVVGTPGYNLSVPASGTSTLSLTQLTEGEFANVPIVTTFGGATATGFTGGVDKRDDLPLPRIPALPSNGFLGVALYNTNLFLGNGGTMCSTDESGASGPLPPNYEVQTVLGGHIAGTHNFTGGMWAGYHLRLGNCNTCLGAAAGYSLDNGDQNLIAGTYAGLMSTTGYHNCYLGVGAGQMNVDGNLNVYVGTDNSLNGITGSQNTGVGCSSGTYNIGIHNTYLGFSCFHACTTGNYNTTVGSASMFNLTTATLCTAVGYGAGGGNTTGGSNTYLGDRAGAGNTTGSGNLMAGAWAGMYYGAGADYNTSCTDSVYLGARSRASASGNSNEIVIGAAATGLGSNTAVFGTTATTINRFYGSVGINTDAPSNQFTIKALSTNAYPFMMNTGAAGTPRFGFGLNTTLAKPLGVFLVGDDGGGAYFILSYSNNFTVGGVAGGASSAFCLVLPNTGVAPTDSANLVHLYGKDIAAGRATLGIYTEEALATETITPNRTLTIFHNGVATKIPCLV